MHVFLTLADTFLSVKRNDSLLEVFLLIFLTTNWVNVQLETTLQPHELMFLCFTTHLKLTWSLSYFTSRLSN